MKFRVAVLVTTFLWGACATAPSPVLQEKPTSLSAPRENKPFEKQQTGKPGVSATVSGSKVWITWVIEVSAVQVGLGGDFENWDPAKVVPLTLEKTPQGDFWTVTLPFSAQSVIHYKYYVNGMWKDDPHAPLAVSDGYGGHEGKIVVSDLVQGLKSPNKTQ